MHRLLILLLSSGCAMQAPMSDLLVHMDGGRLAAEAIGVRTHQGGAVAANVVGTAAAKRYVYDRWSGADYVAANNPGKLGVGFYRTRYLVPGRLSASVSAGAGLAGADATAKLAGATFVTASVAYRGGYGVILQQRIFSRSWLSASVGVTYNQVWQAAGVEYDREGCGMCVGPIANEGVFVESVGARVVIVRPLLKMEGGRSDLSYLALDLGYAPELDSAVLGLRLSLGRGK